MPGSLHPTPTTRILPMIEALKDDKIINQLGGRFKFTSLVQHRVRQLMEGDRPLVERNGRSDIEVAVQEIVEGKVTLQLHEDEEAPAAIEA